MTDGGAVGSEDIRQAFARIRTSYGRWILNKPVAEMSKEEACKWVTKGVLLVKDTSEGTEVVPNPLFLADATAAMGA